MKLQYLGDSKDSFKWDYHDYLTHAISYQTLNILLMMTSDDETNDGKSKPDWFPARRKIIDFCNTLRSQRDIYAIQNLPNETGAKYFVNLHRPNDHITKSNRKSYFTGVSNFEDQIIFLDPDNGFEPERSFSEKHVRYSEIFSILEQISFESIVSVFQHFRRIRFIQDFRRIRQRINDFRTPVHTTAIFWHQLMFVLISKSEQIIRRVHSVNKAYSSMYPIELIG